MASASAGAEVCSNGDEVVHYGGNGDQIIRSDGNSDGDEVLRSDGNGDEVIRSDGNSNGDDVLRSDGNDDEIGDKTFVVEDDGKLPVCTEEDEQAAQALVHLASLPIDVFMSDFARHEVFKIIGPFCIPLYFGAGSSDVLEGATALDEIRRGKRAIDGDLNLLDDDNVEECIRMLRFLGFNV